MTGAIDPVSQVLTTLEKFDTVQKAAVEEQVAHELRVIRVAHGTAQLESGKGQHVDVTV